MGLEQRPSDREAGEMILIRSLRLEPGEDISALGPRGAKVLGCPAREIRELKLIKLSLIHI